jgi:hypothetical protein
MARACSVPGTGGSPELKAFESKTGAASMGRL